MSRDETAINIKRRQGRRVTFWGGAGSTHWHFPYADMARAYICESHVSVSIASPFLHLFYVLFERKLHMKIRTENQLRIQLWVVQQVRGMHSSWPLEGLFCWHPRDGILQSPPPNRRTVFVGSTMSFSIRWWHVSTGTNYCQPTAYFKLPSCKFGIFPFESFYQR